MGSEFLDTLIQSQFYYLEVCELTLSIVTITLNRDSRYMCVKKAYIGRNAGELTVPAGAYVYVFSEEDKDGLVTVIYDGQVRLLLLFFVWFFFPRYFPSKHESSLCDSLMLLMLLFLLLMLQRGLLPSLLLETVMKKTKDKRRKVSVRFITIQQHKSLIYS